MKNTTLRFLPDRFRPHVPRRPSPRRYLLPAMVLLASLMIPSIWTVRAVDVHGGDLLPTSVTISLESMVGHSIPALDLGWLRRVAETWPAAAEVRVRLLLPGTVVVEVFPEPVRGSVAMGLSWHAVAADGRLAGCVREPSTPVLEGDGRATDRRDAFVVARRLEASSGAEVVEIEQVTPADYRVGLRFTNREGVVEIHVSPEGTEAETHWCNWMRSEELDVTWADLRWSHRMVFRTRPEMDS